MTDKIREGIKELAETWFAPGGLASRTMPNDRSFEGDVCQFLDANGLVIWKENVELPEKMITVGGSADFKNGFNSGQSHTRAYMLKYIEDCKERLVKEGEVG